MEPKPFCSDQCTGKSSKDKKLRASRYDMSNPFMRWDLVFVGVNFTGSRTIHLCLKVFVLVVFIASVSLVILTKRRGEREGYKINNTFSSSNFVCILLLKYE
jgi:hypothetical protein